ncbi:hypothetical protein GCM10010435_40950 [Winogradskya consettensis]|uniref:Uncharacterized protein n=1 Tax=Winogradskya consettensis TaxID=113560 RepID=A0A919VN71_9ACTN|nr:hypothetical protein [Actinoplanes consettensis]GIM69792.1 hypothetical protein Aco04nite_17080 [Actinoplanes consettensis]
MYFNDHTGTSSSPLRRGWRFFVSSRPAQITTGGVVAVLLTGAITGAAASNDKGEDPASGTPAAAEQQQFPAGLLRGGGGTTTTNGAPGSSPATPGVTGEGLGAPVAGEAVNPPPAAAPAAKPQPATTPTAATSPATVPPQSQTKAVTYDAIAGLGCTGKGTSYSNHGWFKKGDAGWWTLAYGSTREGGCDGRFDDMPMSGKAHEDTAGQAILYGFQVGAARQNCTLSIYVPTSSSSRDVPAAPVHLSILTGTGVGSPLYTSPAPDKYISQGAHNSSWLALGSYPVSNGTIGVKVTNRGYSAGYPMTYPHIAGGAVRAHCTQA